MKIIENIVPILIVIIIMMIVYCYFVHWDTIKLKMMGRKSRALAKRARKSAKRELAREIHPADDVKINVYANPHMDTMIANIQGCQLPATINLSAGLATCSMPYSVDSNIQSREIPAPGQKLGSIDTGGIPVRLTLLTSDGTKIAAANCRGEVQYIFGLHGLFDDSIKFASKGGKLRIERIA